MSLQPHTKRVRCRVSKDSLMLAMVHVIHELDWCYFWQDEKRHKKAMEKFKAIETQLEKRKLLNP